MKQWVVAVDGPSGSGKSTVSRRLARSLGAAYLDTGAMYRAVTWAVLNAGVDPQDATTVAQVAAEASVVSGTDPTNPTIEVDGVAVDREIRGPEVTAAVSAVSAIPAVRELLVAQQRAIIATCGSIVVEG
ncbi:MAG TPA: (d)CMP kinase, partial [Rugosimonospora sp.]|nr:(d)CMP kinase [Rugosimonospora sp.]